MLEDIEITRAEDVTKHGSHDQKTHGSWASGNYENFEDWFKDEIKVFSSYGERLLYLEETLSSQRLKGFTEMAYPGFSGAISTYESSRGDDINEALRDPQISEDGYKSTIDLLDKAMDIAPPLSEELIAYRGVKGGEGLNFFTSKKVGDVYEDKGYTSTSIAPDVAQQFAQKFGYADPKNDGLIFRMRIPAGSKGIFPSGYHEPMYGWKPDSTEAEFLLPRGSKFKIVAQRGKVWDIELVP
jgi:hypothetical protein